MGRDEHNTRKILLDLGIGDYNATMILPYMFMGPAQTDPQMAQVQLLTKALQRNLIVMGATWIKASGWIDDDTAHCLHALVGPNWNNVSWFELCQAVLVAKAKGKKLGKAYLHGAPGGVVLEGMGFSLPSPPDVPGGIVTYAIAGYLLYRYLKKKG